MEVQYALMLVYCQDGIQNGGVLLIDHAEDVFFYDSNVCCELIKAKLQKRLTVSNEILGLICIIKVNPFIPNIS